MWSDNEKEEYIPIDCRLPTLPLASLESDDALLTLDILEERIMVEFGSVLVRDQGLIFYFKNLKKKIFGC